MKNKIILIFIILLGIYFISMQLCSVSGSKPVVTLDSLSNNTIISTLTLDVSGKITDADGDQSSVKVWIEGTNIEKTSTSVSSGNYYVTLDLRALEQKSYTLKVQGFDSNKNASDIVSVNFQYTYGVAPNINVTSPNEDTINTDSPTINIKGMAIDVNNDLTSISIYIENYPSVKINDLNFDPVNSKSFDENLDISSLSPGSYKIIIEAKDYRNNKKQVIKDLKYKINSSPNAPSIQNLSISDNAQITTSLLNITGKILDADGNAYNVCAYIENYKDSTYVYENFNPTDTYDFTLTINLNSFGAGSYKLIIEAKDTQENRTTKAINFTYQPPNPSAPAIQIESPSDNSQIYETSLTISGSITDANSDAISVKAYVVNHEDTIKAETTFLQTNYKYFYLNLNLIDLPKGNYQIKVEAKDAANNVSTKTINISYEVEHLRLDLTSPSNNANITNPQISIIGTIYDVAGDAIKVTAWIEGYSSSIINSIDIDPPKASENFNISLDISSLSNGSYTLKVEGRDQKNNTIIKSIPINYYKNAPIINISEPSDNQQINSSNLQIFGNASDNENDFKMVSAWIEGYKDQTIQSYQVDTPTGYTSFNLILNISILKAGFYTLKIEAKDFSDNTSIKQLTIEYKGIKPTLTINYPTNNSTVVNKNLVVTGIINDYDEDAIKLEIEINTASNTKQTINFNKSGSYNFEVTFNLSNFNYGTYQIIAKATDSYGNISENAIVNFNYDRGVAPNIEISYPASNQTVSNGSSFSVSVNVTDANNDAKYIKVWVDGYENTIKNEINFALTGNENFNIPLDLSSLLAGQYILKVLAKDDHDNINTVSRTFNYTGSEPSISLSRPTTNEIVRSDYLSVEGQILDNDSDAIYVKAYIDGYESATKVEQNFNATNQYNFNLSIQLFNKVIAGQYTLKIEAKDQYNNIKIYSRTFYYAGTKPGVTISTPAPLSNVSLPTLTVSGTISDIDKDIASLTIWIEENNGNNTNITQTIYFSGNNEQENFSVNLDITGLKIWNNPHRIKVVAKDSYNNESDLVERLFNVMIPPNYGQKPTINVNSPSNEIALTTSTINISGTASDVDDDLYFMRVEVIGYSDVYVHHYFSNGSSPCGSTPVNFSVELNLASLNPGVYTLKIFAEDQANNKSDIVYRTIFYSVGATNILQNGNFSNHKDEYSNNYYNSSVISEFLNNSTNGDWLANWTFYIYENNALDNQIGIDLNGLFIRYYSSMQNNLSNEKFKISQNLNHTVTSKTRLYIKFNIMNYVGASNPSESPLQIYINSGTILASYSTESGTSNGKNFASNLATNTDYEFDFSLKDDANVPIDTVINQLYILVKAKHWDVVIYEIKLYEAQN